MTLSTLSGSVVDGPLIGATITVTDANGAEILTDLSNRTASYRIDVPAGTAYPVLIRAIGGVDQVTGEQASFTLMTAALDPRTTVANISSISTMLVKTAQCMGGLTAANLQAARDTFFQHFSFGLDPAVMPSPTSTPVAPHNVAHFLKANEAVAEMVRRTRDALLGTGDEVSEDDLIIQLACDLADGVLDGLGDGVSPRLVATSQVVAAGILVEVLQNQLAVNGIDATAALDAAIPIAVPNATVTTADVTLTAGVFEQTRIAIQAALTVTPSESLVLLAGAIEDAVPGSSPADIVSAMPAGAAGQLQAAVASVPAAADGTITLANQRVAAASTAPRPSVSFSGSPASVQPTGQATLAWAVSDATACAASGGWSGLKALSGNESTGSLSTSTAYGLVCTGSGGTLTESLTVTAASATPAPSVTLSASPMSVAYNGTTTLNWSASHADSCTASGGWSGDKPTSDSETTAALTADRSFTLTCNGAGGSDTRSVTVSVGAPPAPPPNPLVSISASPASVAYNGDTTLNWSVSNADTCTASGGWLGDKSTSGGSQTIGSLTSSVTFSLNCTGPGGSGSDSVNVAVALPPTPTVSLSASPSSVAYNGSTTLNWSTSDATSCAASGDWSGSSMGTTGTQTVNSLTVDSSFTLTCSGPGGSRARTANVTVGAAPTPTLSFAAQPSTVPKNGGSQLSWNGGNVSSCAASGDWLGAKGTSGIESTGPLSNDRSYTLTCNGTGGDITRTVMVTINGTLGSALLTWTPPTTNTDGSTLTDLAGYSIHYGNSSGGPYPTTVSLTDPGSSSHLVENLPTGTYYFVITALNTSSVESVNSNEASGAIP